MAFKSTWGSWICWSGLVLMIGVAASARGGITPSEILDPSTGQIGGKVAIAVAPAKYDDGKLEILSPWGFEAHLTGYDDPSVDLVFPCGIWFQPPPGRYRAWIESEWQVSSFSMVLIHSGRSFRGRGMIAAIPVSEAGRVALRPDVAKDPHLVLRLLHAGSYLEGRFPRWELSRRKATHEVRKGLLMPAGLTIGALWDERSQSYTAISRPFEVKARQTVTVPLERPSGVADVVAQVQRHALASTAGDLDAEVLLQRQGRKLPPDLKIPMADRIYAIWHGLAPGPAELRAEWQQGILEPQRLNLSAGKIERLIGTLKPQYLRFNLKK